jgi:DNA-directed RNA polymerase specialized sigma24 family protein
VTSQVLARARAGDEDAFRELTDRYRRELQVHIYRIVGSVHDAEDLLQETLLAATAPSMRSGRPDAAPRICSG